ncbi:MAG: GNAT family N-acetyltransferase [Pelagibacterales bacterium]|nr:GNAT family N-acetyltransferase [Pelagibacterales bacterium]
MLKTPRLTLRPLEKEDLAMLYKLYSNQEVLRLMTDNIQMLETVKKLIALQIQHQKKFGYSLMAVIENETGNFIGRAGIINRVLNPEIGEEDEVRFAIFPEFWGKGYGKEILQEIICFAKDDLKLPGIVAANTPRNEKAVEFLKKNGFKYIKTLIERGHYIREIQYYTMSFPQNIKNKAVQTAISD